MKKNKHYLNSFIILLLVICGFIINPPVIPKKPVTQCYQYFCVTPPQVTVINIYDISSGNPKLVGYCTTGENGCCPDPMLLDEEKRYNAKPVCQPYVQGVEFTPCEYNPLTLECPE